MEFPRLPSAAPAPLGRSFEALVQNADAQAWPDAAWNARELTEFLRFYLAAAALGARRAELSDFSAPAENQWTQRALDALEPERYEIHAAIGPLWKTTAAISAELLGLFEQERFVDPLQFRNAIEKIVPALTRLAERLNAFFAGWSEATRPSAGGLEIDLVRGQERINLHPYLEISDDPDTGTLGQWFGYAGAGPTGTLLYRNLHLGNLSQRDTRTPAASSGEEATPRSGRPLAGVQRAFSDDPEAAPPEFILAALRRQLAEAAGGYLLVEGRSGAGKTYLARFFSHQGTRGALYYSLEDDPDADAGLLPFRLDEALRRLDEGAFPAPEAVRSALVAQNNPSKRLPSYLLMLRRALEEPVTLLLDGIDRRHTALLEVLPRQLPPQVSVVLLYDPAQLGEEMLRHFEELSLSGGRVRLDPQTEPYRELVARTFGSENTWLDARILRHGRDSGLWTQAEPSVAAYLKAVRARVGEEAWKRHYIALLTLLAASREPAPLPWLADWLGSWPDLLSVANRLGPLLRLEEDRLLVSHPEVRRELETEYARELAAAGRILAHFGAREVRGDRPDLAPLRWVAASGEPALLRRCLTDEEWIRKLWEGLGGFSCRHLEVTRLWRRALAGLAARDESLRRQLARMGLLLSRQCMQHADADRANAELDRAVELLSELVRFGEPDQAMIRELAGAHRRRAQLHLERANYQQARSDARRAQELHQRLDDGGSAAEQAEALRLEGLALASTGELEPALESLSRAIERSRAGAERPRWLRESAEVRHRMGELETAAEELELALSELQGLDIPEETALCLARRAQVRDEQGSCEPALEDARGASSLLEGLVEKGRRLDLRAHWADTLHIQGLLLFSQGGGDPELSRGVELYRRLVEEGESRHAPELARSLGDRGLVRSRAGEGAALDDYAEALNLLQRLVEDERRLNLRGELARAYNNRGQCLMRRGRLEEARRDFNAAVEHFGMLAERQGQAEYLPELGLALFNRAGAHRRLGGLLDACVDYDRSIERLLEAQKSGELVDEELSAAYVNRGIARVSAERIPEALEDYARAAELGCETAVALNNRGEALSRQGRRTEALEDYSRALALHRGSEASGDLARLLDNRAAVLLELDRAQEARGEAERALQLQPAGVLDQAAGWALAARASENLGELPRACEEYHRAVELYRGLPEAREELGHVCHRLARLEERRGQLKSALQWLEESSALLSGEDLAQVELTRSSVLLGLGLPQEAGRATLRCTELSRDEAVEARARYHRGRALEGIHRPADARKEYDRALQLYARLVEEHSRYELCAAMAATYRRRARVGENTDLALADYAWSIDLLRELVHHQGRNELRLELAAVHRERGELHGLNGNRQAQDADLKESVVLYNALLQEGQDESAQPLAEMCIKLAALRRLGGDLSAARNLIQRAIRTLTTYPEPGPRLLAAALSEAAAGAEARREFLKALEHRNQAVESLDELVRIHGFKEREKELLEERRRRARLLDSLGRLEEALEDLELAARGYRRWDDRASLTRTMSDQALLLSRLDRLAEAAEHFQKAIEAAPDAGVKAEVHWCRGRSLSLRGKDADALADMTEAVRLLEDQPGGALTRALQRRGEVLRHLQRFQEALADFERAGQLFQLAPARETEDRILLAGVKLGRGSCLVRIGRTADGLAELEEAVEQLNALSEEHDYASIREQLAEAYFERARALLAADPIMSLYSIRNTIGIYRAATAREGELEHREVLAEAYLFRARLLEQMNKADQAREDYELAASIYTALVEAEGRSELLDQLLDCRKALGA
ncbi:MAG: tetratricopeptide repeat protein [Armatimonadetes bacterium]|nr:tetratricopeptide repeat protein [Armatimonadota bacterium]